MTRKVKGVRVADVWHKWPEERPKDGQWIVIFHNTFGELIGKYNEDTCGILTMSYIEHRFGYGRLYWKRLPKKYKIEVKGDKLTIIREVEK